MAFANWIRRKKTVYAVDGSDNRSFSTIGDSRNQAFGLARILAVDQTQGLLNQYVGLGGRTLDKEEDAKDTRIKSASSK